MKQLLEGTSSRKVSKWKLPIVVEFYCEQPTIRQVDLNDSFLEILKSKSQQLRQSK